MNLIQNQMYENIHGFLIVRNGKLVHEAYFSGNHGRNGVIAFDRDLLHDIRSVSKRVTSILIGIAIHRGYIESIDVPFIQLFPEYTHCFTCPDDQRRNIA